MRIGFDGAHATGNMLAITGVSAAALGLIVELAGQLHLSYLHYVAHSKVEIYAVSSDDFFIFGDALSEAGFDLEGYCPQIDQALWSDRRREWLV